MTARVYYGPPRDLAAEPLRDFDEVVGIVTGRDVIVLSGKRWALQLIPGHPGPVVGELWQREAERASEWGPPYRPFARRWLFARHECPNLFHPDSMGDCKLCGATS